MAERSGRKNWSNAARQGLSNTSNRFAGEIVAPSVAAIEEVSEPIVAVFKNPVTGEDIPLTQSQLESLEYRAPSMAQQMAETPGVGVSMAFDKAKEILERQKAIGAIQPRSLAPEIVESTGKEDYSRFGSTGDTQVGTSQQINENIARVLNQRVPTYIEGNENLGGMVGYKLPTVERLDGEPVEFLASIPTNTVAADADVDVDIVPLKDVDYIYDPVAQGDVDAYRTGTTPGVYSDEVVPEVGTVTVRQGIPSSEFPQRVSEEGRSIDEMRQMRGSTVINELQRRAMKQAYNQAAGNESELYLQGLKRIRARNLEDEQRFILEHEYGLNIDDLRREPPTISAVPRNPAAIYDIESLQPRMTPQEAGEQRILDMLKQDAMRKAASLEAGMDTYSPIMGRNAGGVDMARLDAVSRAEGLEAGMDSYGPIMGRNAGGAMDLGIIPEPVGNWAGDLLRDNRVRLGLAGLGGVGLIGLIANRVSNNREERRQAAANSLNYPTMTGY